MELAAFAALETCVGIFPPPPFCPQLPVRGTRLVTSESHNNSCNGIFGDRQEDSGSSKRQSGNSTACETTERSDSPVASREHQRHASDQGLSPQQGQEQPHERQRQRWQRVWRDQEFRRESCEEVVCGVDIPEAAAHLTCIVRHRTLEVYDSSPRPRFLPRIQACASSGEAIAAAAREAPLPSTAAEANSAHIEAALAQAAAAVPVMPCLLRVCLPAPLLSPGLFDAVLARDSPPRAAAGAYHRPAGGTCCSGTKAESCKESTTDRSCSSDGYRSSFNERGSRHTGAVSAGGSNSVGRGHSRYPKADCGASSDIRDSNYTRGEDTSAGADCCEVRLGAVYTGLAGNFIDRNRDVFGGAKTDSLRSDSLIASRSQGTTAATCTAVKKKSASGDGTGTFCAAPPALQGGDAAAREKTVEKPRNPGSASATERQKNFNAPLAPSPGPDLMKGHGCLTLPVVTLCFMLTNGELHRMQLRLRDALPRQQHPRRTANNFDTGPRCLEASALPEGKFGTAVARPGQQLLLLMQNHISVMLMRDALPLKGETVAIQCYEEYERCTSRTVHRATFCPFECFLGPPAPRRRNRRLLEPRQHDYQQLWFCEQQQWMQGRDHKEGQVEQGEQVLGEKSKHFRETADQRRHPAAAEASTDFVSDVDMTPETIATASPARSPKTDGLRESPVKPPLRLLLLNSRDVLLELSEPHVYGVLQFRKSCSSSIHRRDRSRGSRGSISKHSTRVKCWNTAASAAAVGAEVATKKDAEGRLDTAEEATECNGMFGQHRRSACSKRKRSFSTSLTEGVSIFRSLASSWRRWKRQKASLLCRAFADHVENAPALPSREEGGRNSNERGAQGQQNSTSESSRTGSVDPLLSCRPVNQSQDTRNISRIVPTNNSAAVAAQSGRLFSSSGSQGGGESTAVTLIKKLMPRRVLPHLLNGVVRLHKRKNQLVAQKWQEERQEALHQPRLQQPLEQGYVHGGDVSCQDQSTETRVRRATAAAAAADFIELHRRRLSFEEMSCRQRFRYLWATSQHVVRLPRAAAGAAGGGGGMRRGDCLLVTCSVVSVPHSQYEKHQQQSPQLSHEKEEICLDGQRSHRLRKSKDLDVSGDEPGTRGGCVGQRDAVFSDFVERETSRETNGPRKMVVVAVWKTRSVCSSRPCAIAAGQVTHRSTVCKARWTTTCEASTVSTDGAPVHAGRCLKAEGTPRTPSLQLLCEYTYTLDNVAGGAQGVQTEAAARSTVTASAAHTTTTGAVGRPAPKTLPGALSGQHIGKRDRPFTAQEGEGDTPLPAELVRQDTCKQKQGDTDLSASTSANCFATAAAPMEFGVYAESVHVAAATTPVPAVPAPATAGCGAGWWIGVALRFISDSDAYEPSRRRSGTSADRGSSGRSEGSSGSTISSSTQRRSGSGSCHVDTSREFLLLRCVASERWRDNWRLERAGQLSWNVEGVLRFPAAAKSCGEAQERQERHQDAFHKNESDEGHPYNSSSFFRRLVAGDTAASTDNREDYHTCRLKQEGEMIRKHGRSQYEYMRKEHHRGLQQRQGLPQTSFLVTSTHLWLFSTAASKPEDLYGSVSGASESQHVRKSTLSNNARTPFLCCCPRRTVWAIPLPNFSPLRCSAHDASATAVLLPRISGDTTPDFVGKQGTTAGDDAAVKQRSVWPAGVEPFRVLHMDDSSCLQPCSNSCCSAVLRNRNREVAETAHVAMVLSGLRAAVRSVLRRCLAALASSAAAEPEGPRAAAAAGAAAAAAVWNYQPLVTDAFPRVFSGARSSSTEAAAALLDWLALETAERLAGCDIYGQRSAVAAAEEAASGVVGETEEPAQATAGPAAERGGKRHSSGNKFATITSACHSPGLAATYEGMQTEGAEPRHDPLVALLTEYSFLLRDKDAEAQRCTARMEALFSATGRVPQRKIRVSGGMTERKCHRRIAALSSRVRLLLELLTDAVCRNSLAIQHEHSRQVGDRIDQQMEEESPRYRQRERQERSQRQHGKEQQKQPDGDVWYAFSDRLTVASIVSLVLCWRLRRLVRRYTIASSSATLPSCAFLGESYVWGDVLQPASATLNTAFSVGQYSLSSTELHTPSGPVAAGSSSPASQCEIYSSPYYSVEDTLLHHPLGCALAKGSFENSASSTTPAVNPSGPDQASVCDRVSSSLGTAAVERARSLTASHQCRFAVPLVISRHCGGVQADVGETAAPPGAARVLPRFAKERSCHWLSVIRPALTMAEEIDWQLRHGMKDVVFDAAELTIAAAAEEEKEETTEQGMKGRPARDLTVESDKSFFDRETEEAAEADADCLALRSLLNWLMPPESLRQTMQYEAVSAPAAGEGATTEDGEMLAEAEEARGGTYSFRQYSLWPHVHQNSARYAGSTRRVPHQGAFRQANRVGHQVPWSATDTYSIAAKSAAEGIPVTEGSPDSVPQVEVGVSFLADFLCGKDRYTRRDEQHPWCYCSSRSSEFTEAQYRTRQLRKNPSDYPAAVRAADALQRNRQVLVERLQRVLRLNSSVSWHLAAVGSLLRVGAAAVLGMQQHDKEPQPQLRRQQEPQRPGQQPEGISPEPLAASAGDKGQSKGDFAMEDARSISGQAGVSRQQSTAESHCRGEHGMYATSSSRVWRHLRAVLYEGSSSTTRASRGTEIYRSYLLSCAAATIAPHLAACMHPGQSPCGSRTAGATAHLPGASTTRVAAPGGHADKPSITPDGAFIKLLRRISFSTLMPVSLDERVARVGAAGEADISDGRYPIAKAPTTAAEMDSPLQLRVARGGVVLSLLRAQPRGFLSLDTLSDANVAALSPACVAEANTKLPAGTKESTAARHAAAAAVAARVGLECVPFLCSPNSPRWYGSGVSKTAYRQPEQENTASDSLGAWPSMAAGTTTDTDGRDGRPPDPSSHNDEQDRRQKHTKWTLEAEAATASHQDMKSFLSFISSPVQGVLANAIAAGIVAQHELLCNLAVGACYFQKQLLQRQLQQGQEEEPKEARQRPQARNAEQELQQERKQETAWEVSDDDRGGWSPEIRCTTDSWCFAYGDATDAKKYVDSIFQDIWASREIAPGPASPSKVCSSSPERDCSGSKSGRPLSIHADGTSVDRVAARSVSVLFPVGGDDFVSSAEGDATCSESQLLSTVLQALDASLPLAAGLRSLVETPEVAPCKRVLRGQQQRQLRSGLLLQQNLQSESQCPQMAWNKVNVSGHFREGEGATAAGQYRCHRLLAAGEAAAEGPAATRCTSPTHAVDVKEERSAHKGCQLVLFLMFCEYTRGRLTFLTDAVLRHGRKSNKVSKKSRKSEISRSDNHSAERGIQPTKRYSKSDTETYIRHVELLQERWLAPSAATDCNSDIRDSAVERGAAPAAAASEALSAYTTAAAGCGTGASPTADSRLEKNQGVALLLPWLVRGLCESGLLKNVLLAQRLRAASRLADFFCQSPSTLHRLAAHTLHCWAYQQRCLFDANGPAAAGVYSEIQAAARDTARLLSCLQQRALELSHVAAASQDPVLQQHTQRLALLRENQESEQQQAHFRAQDSLHRVQSEEEGERGQRQQQGWHHGQEWLQQQDWEPERQQWHRQQQAWQQQQHDWQQLQQEKAAFPVGGSSGLHRAVREQQRTHIIDGQHGVRPATSQDNEAARRNDVSEAAVEKRISEAYFEGCYAQLLHGIACGLQEFYPETATLMLEFSADQRTRVSCAFRNEGDGLTEHTVKEGDVLVAAARGSMSQECRTPEGAATASMATEEAAGDAEAGAELAAAAARLSVAVAVFQAAARAATTSSRLRGKLFSVLTSIADERRPGAQNSPWCSGAAEAVPTPDDGQSGASARDMRGKQAFALQRGRAGKGIEAKKNRAQLMALLQVCCRMLPSVLPDAAELWNAALTAALEDGNLAAATTMLPMLRSYEDRKEQLLRILAGLLIQQSLGSAEWGGKTVHIHGEAGTPTEKQACVSRHGRDRTACCFAERNSDSYKRSGYSGDAGAVRWRRTLHRLRNAEGVSLAAVRAASRIPQRHLSVEGILLRLSVSAECGREGPAVAAFQLLKKDFLSSGRRSDAALLAFLHAAAVQTHLYSASAAYLGAAATSFRHTAERETAATVAAAEGAALRHFANMVAADEYFPPWLLWGLKQLQDIGQQQQRSAAVAAARSHSRSQFRRGSAFKVARGQIISQHKSSTRDTEKGGLKQRQERGQGAGGEDYKEHIRLVEASERVRLLCLTLVSGEDWIDSAQPRSALVPVAAAATATSMDIGPEVFTSTTSGRAARAAADDAAGQKAARILCSQFQEGLSFVECSASLCANLLLDMHLCESSPFSSFPFSSLLQTSGYTGSAIAPASAGIVLLPSLLRPLLLPASYSHDWPATSSYSPPQKRQTLQRGRRMQQQEQQHMRLEPCTPSPGRLEVALDNALTTRQPGLTAQIEREGGHPVVSEKASVPLCSFSRPTLSATVPVTTRTEALALSSPATLPQYRFSSASAVAAEVAHMEVLKYRKLSEHPPYITTSLARRIAAVAGAKLRLLQAAPFGVAAVEQLPPWNFCAAETVASLAFAGQLCASIQLADILQVDVFIACAAFIAYAVTQQTAVTSDVQATGCWQLLVQQLRLRRACAASGAGPAALALDGVSAVKSGQKVQLEANVRALYSKLLQLLTIVQKQLVQEGSPRPPAFVFECLREGELPADAVAALGRLLHEGRLQEAFALVLREQGEPDERRQQLGSLTRGTEGKELFNSDAFLLKEKKHTEENRRLIGTSAYAFLNLAWPLLIQLQAALAVKAAEQRKQAAARAAAAAAAATEASGTAEGMLARLQDIVARYEKASRLACSRDAQLVNLALKPGMPELFSDLTRPANGDVMDQPQVHTPQRLDGSDAQKLNVQPPKRAYGGAVPLRPTA